MPHSVDDERMMHAIVKDAAIRAANEQRIQDERAMRLALTLFGKL